MSAVCPPIPSSGTPLMVTRPPPPTGAGPLQAARPPIPSSGTPLVATQPPPPTGVAPLHPPSPSSGTPLLGVTVRPLSTPLQQQTLLPLRPTVTSGVPQASIMGPQLGNQHQVSGGLSAAPAQPVTQLLNQQYSTISASPEGSVASSQPPPALSVATMARPPETSAPTTGSATAAQAVDRVCVDLPCTLRPSLTR